MQTALLLDADWHAASEADAYDAHESCLRSALQHAVPFGRRLGDGGAGAGGRPGSGGGAVSVQCRTAKLLWRTDGLQELP